MLNIESHKSKRKPFRFLINIFNSKSLRNRSPYNVLGSINITPLMPGGNKR